MSEVPLYRGYSRVRTHTALGPYVRASALKTPMGPFDTESPF